MENQQGHELLERLAENNQYLEALNEFEKELKNSSDRGLVLVCGSIIDQLLSELLKAFLIKSDSIEKDLFKGTGILATFEAKIQMSYYLGLMSKNEKLNITYLQRIRNKFAHQFINISFESNDIINVCRNFEIPKNCFIPQYIPFPDEETGEFPQLELNPIKKETSAKDRFIFAFKYLYHTLVNKLLTTEFGKRSECDTIITADKAVLGKIKILESSLESYEKVIGEMQELLATMKEEQRPQEDIKEFEARIEQSNKEYEKYSQAFNSLLMPPLKYTYEALKNSMEK
ncbi:transcriptional regulator [Bacillus thuringiensis]|uniref:MltR family transcriptional regulator n=1 Tax=Bacillus thuringiensis TaxID=1428 RepID=UPI000BFE2C7E|nr:MltR family transcriptional regulator [Bacillus thuringiensis]PGW57512.1 transcriptional regulator [Bacillus thuringiensis]